MDKDILERLEEFWGEQWCGCATCGWFPAFYEIQDLLIETKTRGLYWCPCISKDHDDSLNHRGHFVAWKEEYSRGNSEFIEKTMKDLQENHPEIFARLNSESK